MKDPEAIILEFAVRMTKARAAREATPRTIEAIVTSCSWLWSTEPFGNWIDEIWMMSPMSLPGVDEDDFSNGFFAFLTNDDDEEEDEDDNDAARFLHHLIAALQKANPHIGKDVAETRPAT